jgi:hypothetical protein
LISDLTDGRKAVAPSWCLFTRRDPSLLGGSISRLLTVILPPPRLIQTRATASLRPAHDWAWARLPQAQSSQTRLLAAIKRIEDEVDCARRARAWLAKQSVPPSAAIGRFENSLHWVMDMIFVRALQRRTIGVDRFGALIAEAERARLPLGQ